MKWAKDLNRHFSGEDITNDQQVQEEKIFEVTNVPFDLQEKASGNHSEMSLMPVRMAVIKKTRTEMHWPGYGGKENSCGSANWCSRYGEQYGGS